MKKIKTIGTVLMCMLSCMGVTAFAEGNNTYVTETSLYSVEYNGKEVENDKNEECDVYIAIPWEFSNEIPKYNSEQDINVQNTNGQNANGQSQSKKQNSVQTGDDSGVIGYVALAAFSALSICGTSFFRKKEN